MSCYSLCGRGSLPLPSLKNTGDFKSLGLDFMGLRGTICMNVLLKGERETYD